MCVCARGRACVYKGCNKDRRWKWRDSGEAERVGGDEADRCVLNLSKAENSLSDLTWLTLLDFGLFLSHVVVGFCYFLTQTQGHWGGVPTLSPLRRSGCRGRCRYSLELSSKHFFPFRGLLFVSLATLCFLVKQKWGLLWHKFFFFLIDHKTHLLHRCWSITFTSWVSAKTLLGHVVHLIHACPRLIACPTGRRIPKGDVCPLCSTWWAIAGWSNPPPSQSINQSINLFITKLSFNHFLERLKVLDTIKRNQLIPQYYIYAYVCLKDTDTDTYILTIKSG